MLQLIFPKLELFFQNENSSQNLAQGYIRLSV